MQEKKYLKWYNKVGYGSGDLAANCMYALLSSFILIYLTNTVGLNAGIIGTLMMLSKFLDGFTDVIFGSIIDRTKSKMGKARPWMLYSQIGVSACLFLVFSIPSMKPAMQYAYFFVFYTAINAIFYTANNIAYASLTALITKNANERVQLGSIRFMFAIATNIIAMSVVMKMVSGFGGGAQGWRAAALIFAILGLVVNTIAVFSVKEIPLSESEDLQDSDKQQEQTKKLSLIESVKYLVSNKYYLLILGIYILIYFTSGIGQSVSVYWLTYVLGNINMIGIFSMMSMLPMIIILSVTPALVKKFKSMWKVNTMGYVGACIFAVPFVIAAFMKNIPAMLVIMFIRGLCTGPMTGTLNALIAEASEYTYRTKKVRLDGTMFSCSSLGIKVGSGLGTAAAGWMLEIGGYDGLAAVQSSGAISMINFMYVIIPSILAFVTAWLVYLLKVEKANKDLAAAEENMAA